MMKVHAMKGWRYWMGDWDTSRAVAHFPYHTFLFDKVILDQARGGAMRGLATISYFCFSVLLAVRSTMAQ